jgi:para-nitrobenzyl esterase
MRSILVQFLTLIIPFCLSHSVPIIQTTSGKLRGIAVSSTTHAYLGIPFAVPPVSDLRFLAPRPLFTPHVTRNTTNLGPACIQLPTSYIEIPTGESEDCLTLNIWTSRATPSTKSQSGKPVFVWIYGGGWNLGSTSWKCNCFCPYRMSVL